MLWDKMVTIRVNNSRNIIMSRLFSVLNILCILYILHFCFMYPRVFHNHNPKLHSSTVAVAKPIKKPHQDIVIHAETPTRERLLPDDTIYKTLLPETVHSPSAFALRIGIVATSDHKYKTSAKFHNHVDSVECYARARGYAYISRVERDPVKRHLIVRDELPKYDWLLFLDGDVQIVNYARGLEGLIDDAHAVDIIFPTRFINAEVTAGSYLVRNTSWSLDFLTRWGNRDIPGSTVANSDNGILLQLLTDVLFAKGSLTAFDRDAGQKCVDRFNQNYGAGKCCFSNLMGPRREFPHVLLHRRGQGFFRDDFVGSFLLNSDIGVHNKGRWNERIGKKFYRNPDGSCKIIHGPILADLVLPTGIQRYALCVNDHAFASGDPLRLLFPDVWDCFPYCSVNMQIHKFAKCDPTTPRENYNKISTTVCENIKLNFTDEDQPFYIAFKPFHA